MKKTMQLDFTNQLAHIVVDTLDGKEVIIKTWGKGFGWTNDDAMHVIAMHKSYISNLNSVGIKTSINLGEQVIPSDNGEYLIRSVEEYFSQGDLLVALMSSKDKAQILADIDEQLTLLTKLLLGIPPLRGKHFAIDNLWLSVPIDLKPQNAVISDHQAIIIDTFRPQLWADKTVELQPLPSAYPEKQKIAYDEIKTGDIRFQVGRLFGYYVAIATRWYMDQNRNSTIEQIDAFRREVATKTTGILEGLLAQNVAFPKDVARMLVNDANEIKDESITIGDYEGSRYVQTLYETELRER